MGGCLDVWKRGRRGRGRKGARWRGKSLCCLKVVLVRIRTGFCPLTTRKSCHTSHFRRHVRDNTGMTTVSDVLLLKRSKCADAKIRTLDELS